MEQSQLWEIKHRARVSIREQFTENVQKTKIIKKQKELQVTKQKCQGENIAET